MSDIGTGSVLILGSFTANIISINHGGVDRESVPTSHLGTTGGRTFLPGDLYDPGEFEIEYQVDTEDPNNAAAKPPYDGDPATVTVKMPLKSGDSTPAQVSSSGFVTSASPFAIALEGLITGSLTVKLSGALTWADAS